MQTDYINCGPHPGLVVIFLIYSITANSARSVASFAYKLRGYERWYLIAGILHHFNKIMNTRNTRTTTPTQYNFQHTQNLYQCINIQFKLYIPQHLHIKSISMINNSINKSNNRYHPENNSIISNFIRVHITQSIKNITTKALLRQ